MKVSKKNRFLFFLFASENNRKENYNRYSPSPACCTFLGFVPLPIFYDRFFLLDKTRKKEKKIGTFFALPKIKNTSGASSATIGVVSTATKRHKKGA